MWEGTAAVHGFSTLVRGGLGAPIGGLRKVRPVEGNFHPNQGWPRSMFSFHDCELLFYIYSETKITLCQLCFNNTFFKTCLLYDKVFSMINVFYIIISWLLCIRMERHAFEWQLFSFQGEALWVSGELCPNLEGFLKELSPWRKMELDPTTRPPPWLLTAFSSRYLFPFQRVWISPLNGVGVGAQRGSMCND